MDLRAVGSYAAGVALTGISETRFASFKRHIRWVCGCSVVIFSSTLDFRYCCLSWELVSSLCHQSLNLF
jgi:hypothetical protein